MRTCVSTAATVLLAAGGCWFEPSEFTPASDANVCGNDRLDEDEDCDDTVFRIQDCVSAGPFSGGSLSCDSRCRLDVTSCDSRPSPPRPRRPMQDAHIGSIALPSSLRPGFSWSPSVPAGDLPLLYELDYSTDPTFADKTTVQTSALSHRPDMPLATAMLPPVGARYYWRVRACQGSECSDYSPPRWFHLGRRPGDLNGDGYSDLAIGAPGAGAGAVHLVMGAPDAPLALTASTVLGGFTAMDDFGGSVAALGDVNGDSYSDLVVGADNVDVIAWPSAGSAYVYLGGPGPALTPTPAATLTGDSAFAGLGVSVGAGGDVNGDGHADVLVRSFVDVRIYFGGPGDTFDATPDSILPIPYVAAAASAGDINGDGRADIVVGINDGANPGRALVFLGGEDPFAEPASLVVASSDNTDFAGTVAPAGDMNGDGFADVAIGSEAIDRAWVHLGSETGLSPEPHVTLSGAASSFFGASASYAGDLNGDGYDDLVVGAPVPPGSATVFLGGSPLDAEGDGTLIGGIGAGEYFGASVAAAGDVNGDGFDDVAIGATGTSNGGGSAGSAHLFHGATGSTFDGVSDGNFYGEPGEEAGAAVARETVSGASGTWRSDSTRPARDICIARHGERPCRPHRRRRGTSP